MRKSRLTEAQIIGILKQAEGGAKVGDLAREHGVKELEDENRRLKQMVADQALDIDALKTCLLYTSDAADE